jgi:hypothetical protein
MKAIYTLSNVRESSVREVWCGGGEKIIHTLHNKIIKFSALFFVSIFFTLFSVRFFIFELCR